MAGTRTPKPATPCGSSLTRVVDHIPEPSQQTVHTWGTVLLRQGDLEEAGRHFERAIELDPQSAESLAELGVAFDR